LWSVDARALLCVCMSVTIVNVNVCERTDRRPDR